MLAWLTAEEQVLPTGPSLPTPPEITIAAAGSRVDVDVTFSITNEGEVHAVVVRGNGKPPTNIDPAQSPINACHIYETTGIYQIAVTINNGENIARSTKPVIIQQATPTPPQPGATSRCQKSCRKNLIRIDVIERQHDRL